MKKSFSIIEIIFVIVIIAIISAYALNKYSYSLDKANILKIKSEIALINNAINQLYSNQILTGNSTFTLERLDEAQINSANEIIFNGYNEYVLLDDIVVSTDENKKKLGHWIKLSDTEYKVYFSKDSSLIFTLDSDKEIFSCNSDDDLCKELKE